MFRIILQMWCCATLAAYAAAGVGADAWPSNVVKLVVTFPPGGSTDVTARLIAEKLRADLGRSVIVDNDVRAAWRFRGVNANASSFADNRSGPERTALAVLDLVSHDGDPLLVGFLNRRDHVGPDDAGPDFEHLNAGSRQPFGVERDGHAERGFGDVWNN